MSCKLSGHLQELSKSTNNIVEKILLLCLLWVQSLSSSEERNRRGKISVHNCDFVIIMNSQIFGNEHHRVKTFLKFYVICNVQIAMHLLYCFQCHPCDFLCSRSNAAKWVWSSWKLFSESRILHGTQPNRPHLGSGLDSIHPDTTHRSDWSVRTCDTTILLFGNERSFLMMQEKHLLAHKYKSCEKTVEQRQERCRPW